MPEIEYEWEKKRRENSEAEKLLDSLILESTKNGSLVWKRHWFGIYRYVAKVGQYTLKLLDNSGDWHTVYISMKGVKKDLYADGKEVWYFLTGQKEGSKPDRNQLIQELQKRGNA